MGLTFFLIDIVRAISLVTFNSSMKSFLLGSTRLVTSPTGAILYSSDYLPYGASSGTSGTFTPEFEYTGKLIDSISDLYYYGARFYSPEIDRFITEDTTTGSLDDPLSLNRYEYARDNPEAITDPTGHDWWSSLTSAVSNTVSSAVSTVTSAATSVGDDIVQAASNPENQAIALTVGVDVGTAVAIAATDGAILATPEGQGLLGAAISTTSYTLSEGSDANLGGALGAAISGGIAGATGGAASEMGILVGGAISAGGSMAGDVFGSVVTSEISGKPMTLNFEQILMGGAISFGTFGAGKYIGGYVGNWIGTDVGRSATRTSTLWNSFLSPSDHPRAAYQVYSRLTEESFHYGGELSFSHFFG